MRIGRLALGLVAAALIVSITACNSEAPAAVVIDSDERDTSATVQVGEQVPVRLVFIGGCSSPIYMDAEATGEWQVSPADGAKVTDGKFVATKPGVYRVTCTVPERDGETSLPARITVKPRSADAAPEQGTDGGVALMEDDAAVDLFKLESLLAVQSGPPKPTVFKLNTPALITEIMNYHYNDGRGATPGSIGLKAEDGTTYGPWKVEISKEGQGGVPDAYWFVRPDVEVPAGTYTVIDSDPSSWSWNDETGGMGVSFVKGIPR